jgi:hypothetical protein
MKPSPPDPLPNLGEGGQSRRIWRGEGKPIRISPEFLNLELLGLGEVGDAEVAKDAEDFVEVVVVLGAGGEEVGGAVAIIK